MPPLRVPHSFERARITYHGSRETFPGDGGEQFRRRPAYPKLPRHSQGASVPFRTANGSSAATSQVPPLHDDSDPEIPSLLSSKGELYGTLRYAASENVRVFGLLPNLQSCLDTKIVGVRYYSGYATVSEIVLCKEPNNPYDGNAIRVDNVFGSQIGHIPKTVAAKLAPYLVCRTCTFPLPALIERVPSSPGSRTMTIYRSRRFSRARKDIMNARSMSPFMGPPIG